MMQKGSNRLLAVKTYRRGKTPKYVLVEKI